MTVQPLTYELLDDLALAAARRKGDPEAHLRSTFVQRVGPLLELVAIDRTGKLPLASLPACPMTEALTRTLYDRHQSSGDHLTQGQGRLGFILTNREPQREDQALWVCFCRKAQEAAELSLPKPIAQGLIGAMREIEENIHRHSERSYDGVVGYRGTRNEFEFVVADSGIGVLKSLRTSPDYAQLNDVGSAIKTALADGHSRLNYVKQGHGYGFHDLFVGLANLHGQLRFRSGDHALTIDGTSPSLITARLSQKVEIPGFLASVVCSFKPPLPFH